MADLQHFVFFIIAVVFAAVSALFSFLFLFLKIPDDGFLRNYRSCRKLLAVLYLCYASCAVAALSFRTEFGDSLEVYLSLGLIFSSLIIITGAFAFVTIVNADYLKMRVVVPALAPTIVLSVLLLAALIIDTAPGFRSTVYGLFALYFAGQIVYTGRLIVTQLRKAMERMDNYFSGRERQFFSWVRPLLALFLMDGIVSLACFIIPSWSLLIPSLIFSGTAFFILAVKFLNYSYEFKLVRPVIAAEIEEVSSDRARPIGKAALEEPRGRKSKLAGQDVDKLLRRLDGYMATAKPYLDPELTIESLGRELGLPSHQLSELINERHGMNFRNYVNSFRVEEVKRLLAERKDINILEAAFAGGFNSKGTFNTVFLKSTGKSPREWRRGNYQDAAAG